MAGTRRSNRLSGGNSSPSSSPKSGSKRKADASPKDRESKKVQKTLEETLSNDIRNDDDEMRDLPTEDRKAEGITRKTQNGDREAMSTDNKAEKSAEKESEEALDANTGESEQSNHPPFDPKHAANEVQNGKTATIAKPEVDSKDPDEQPAKGEEARDDTRKSNGSASNGNGSLIEDQSARKEFIPSNIVEKGIIYFFTRGRVNVEEPEGVQDLQRTFFVLRPIPKGAKLGDGAIDDAQSNRLLALPKKVFPTSGQDRFMAFVEKAKASMSELKEFFSGSDYKTKAGDSRHTPAVTPIGEGVYAITKVERSAHLAYMLTIPDTPGDVQKELGLSEKGSFVLSLKNPKNKGPANTQLPESPDFPESIMEDFGGLAWMPVQKSEYLDYANAQLLLIGEHQDKFGSATEAQDGDSKKESPEEELKKLEDEDQVRVEALDGEDAVFKDLHISKKEYSTVQTTW